MHSRKNTTGRGLGLSICKTLIEQMGGEVFVDSQINEGTKFSIIFKVQCRTASQGSKISKPSMTDSSHRRKVKIAPQRKHSSLQSIG